jgi:outer membrane protein assembly factor BamD
MSKALPSLAVYQLIGIFNLIATVLSGCALTAPERFTSDKPLYEYANKLYSEHDYTEAITYYESLRNRFPQSPYALDAELNVADAYFEKESWAEAEVSYQSFRTLHPTHPKIPYVVFRMGMTHVKRIPRGSGRDQTHTEQAISILNDVITRWPESTERPEAEKWLVKCRKNLAERELYVANFYLKRKDYRAAVSRLQTLRSNPDYGDFRAEATYKLGYAYYKLSQPNEATEVLSPLAQDSANTPYREEAKRLLGKISK